MFLFGAWIYAAFFGLDYGWFLFGLTLIGLVCFIDDIHSLPDSLRLVVQFASMFLMFYQFGILSFNGNKMITTSGGGALICPDKETADKAKWYAAQAREGYPYYPHEVVGYNYRLSNISACIERAQLTVLDDHIAISLTTSTFNLFTASCRRLLKALPCTPILDRKVTPIFGSALLRLTPTYVSRAKRTPTIPS